MYHPRIVHLCNVKEVAPSKRLNSKALIFLFYIFLSWFHNIEVNQSQALIPPDLKMGHLAFLSNLQAPLPLPTLKYSQVFMINQCGIKYVLENKVYACVYFNRLCALKSVVCADM